MFGTGVFGGTSSTFGGGGFGTSTNTGGSTLFGQSAQTQPTASVFGGSASGSSTGFGGQLFGSTPTGNSTAASGVFGGQTGSIFGQPAKSTTSIFGSTGNTSLTPFSTSGTAQPSGSSIPFKVVTGTDQMIKNGMQTQINTQLQCIVVMKEYEHKSLEELRCEDYQLNRKGPQTTVFGGTTTEVATAPPSGGLFSGLFNSTPTAGSSSFLGQTSGSGLFGSLNQHKPAGGLFGTGGAAAAPTSTTFGGTSSLGFGSNTSAPQTTSVFGANNAGSSLFSSQQQQPTQQGLNVFGQKLQTTPAASTLSFGPFGSTSTLNKSLFGGGDACGTGSGTSAFGTGSLFSSTLAPQQNKPFSFSAPFTPVSQTSVQPLAFGSGAIGASTSVFSNLASTPSVNFGGGAATTPQTTTSVSAPTGTTSFFGATPALLAFGAGAATTQTPVSTGAPTAFGTGLLSGGNVGGLFGSVSTGSTGLGFNTTSGAAAAGAFSFGSGGSMLQPPQQLQVSQPLLQPQQLQHGAMITFATSPYKDNQLFYNLISNRKVEEMAKPTNPAAQRQFRVEAGRGRRTDTSLAKRSSVCVSTSPAVKSLTFPVANNKNSSICRFQIYDLLGDEEFGYDLLKPKAPSVKKLVMNIEKCGEAGLGGMTKQGRSRSTISISPGTLRRAKIPLNSTLLNNNELSYNGGSGKPAEIDDTVLVETRDVIPINFGDTSLTSFLLDHSNNGISDLGNHNQTLANGTSTAVEVTNVSSSVISEGGCGGSKSDPQFEILPHGNSQKIGLGNGSPSLRRCAKSGVICTRPGYYVCPTIDELDRIMDADGNCIVRELEVGRQGFGRIRYVEPVNVANINIDEIVLFRHKEVVVYPDDNSKPPLGQGLNCAAEIELERVWPIDKESNDPVRLPQQIKALNYEAKLRRACVRLDAQFISYDDDLGVWKFGVKHFSSYSCDVEEVTEYRDYS